MKILDEGIKKKIVYILQNHNVSRAAVFGSFARQEAKEDSDIDLLVELPETKSLLDLVELKLDLQDNLGKDVDVITYGALNLRIRDRVLAERVEIL